MWLFYQINQDICCNFSTVMLRLYKGCKADCNAVLDVIYANIGLSIIETFQTIHLKVYSPCCASRLPTALFLHYFSITHYCVLNTFKHTFARTQRVMPITRVYGTPPTKVAQLWYGAVGRWCYLSKMSYANKLLSASFWIDCHLNPSFWRSLLRLPFLQGSHPFPVIDIS